MCGCRKSQRRARERRDMGHGVEGGGVGWGGLGGVFIVCVCVFFSVRGDGQGVLHPTGVSIRPPPCGARA